MTMQTGPNEKEKCKRLETKIAKLQLQTEKAYLSRRKSSSEMYNTQWSRG